MSVNMNKTIYAAAVAALASLSISNNASAQIGKPFIHDPSSIVECDGKYYTFGTGGGGLISADGWTWESGAVRPGGGAAPDAMKIGDRYLIAYSATGGGLGGGHAGRVLTMWNKTLDPNSPDFAYTEAIEVAHSEMDEDCDAIDAGLLMGPDGRLWLTYGTYFGHIRQIELDPETGARKAGSEPINIAIDCEASTMMYRNGWYYLLGTHGTCCDGPNSTYNIVVGRSKNPTGPFLDNMGRDMMKGGGKMLIAAGNRKTGAGHFGRYLGTEEGVDVFSFHWEADFDRSGRSVLAVLPLLWVNDWPVAGSPVKNGTYEIESVRRGYSLELAVDFVRMQGGMRGFFRGQDNQPEVILENQKLEDVIGGWPEGNIDIRIGDYMFRPHQRWTITEVPEAGGYLTAPYYKITIEGTNRALAATADKEVVSVPEYTGAPEQLWRIEQLTDGTYRIMPKSDESVCLMSVADSTPSLGKFDFNSDNCKWNFCDR